MLRYQWVLFWMNLNGVLPETKAKTHMFSSLDKVVHAKSLSEGMSFVTIRYSGTDSSWR